MTQKAQNNASGKVALHKTDWKEDIRMTLTQKRLLLLAVIAMIAFVLGRLAVRGVLNLLVGGTLFGGNFL